jgi:hypothetical protein
MRMMSTTFRTNAPSEPGGVPAPASDLASKANREAALRERGLLPPLKPKDLSRLEWEQDQHLPVVDLSDKPVVAVDGDATKATTAANLVKQEWEAKHRPDDTDLCRMKTFKFGGLPSPVPSINESSAQLESPVEANNRCSSPIINLQDEHSYTEDNPDVSGSLPPRTKRTPPPLVLDPHAIVASDYLLSPQSPATPSKNDIPLPPSPLPSPQRLRATSVGKRADPEDAQVSSFPFHNSSFTSLKSELPAVLLSPPPSASLDGATDLAHNDPLAFPQPRFLTESGSLETTPSLDNSSQTMTVSSLSTSESVPNMGKAKTNMLKVKVHDRNIPMIIESPIEETSLSKDSVLGSDINHEPSSAEKYDGQQSASIQVDKGKLTAPLDVVHNNSKNSIKRGQTLDPSTTVAAKKRLSILSSLRRSVVGSFSRSKTMLSANGRNQKTFDASHLPPSPTVPASLIEQRGNGLTDPLFPGPRNSDVGPIASVARVAAAPIIYSRGTILNEVRNIKDEETRRVTELAFLG